MVNVMKFGMKNIKNVELMIQNIPGDATLEEPT